MAIDEIQMTMDCKAKFQTSNIYIPIMQKLSINYSISLWLETKSMEYGIKHGGLQEVLGYKKCIYIGASIKKKIIARLSLDLQCFEKISKASRSKLAKSFMDLLELR